jgi:hypothetical protein
MGASFQPQGTQGSSTSECLLDVPFEAYTDSPDGYVNKAPRVQTVPCATAPHPSWRQRLASFVPSFASRQDEDSLPLLSEDHHPQRKRSCRSRCSSGLVRALIVFFVMLYV